MPQIQNAILGRDVDLSGFTPRNVGTPADFNFDLSGIQLSPPIAVDDRTSRGIDQVNRGGKVGRDNVRRRIK